MQAARERFVQREGTYGTLGELRAVLSGGRMECGRDVVVRGGDEEREETDGGHTVQDVRGPWEGFGVCF